MNEFAKTWTSVCHSLYSAPCLEPKPQLKCLLNWGELSDISLYLLWKTQPGARPARQRHLFPDTTGLFSWCWSRDVAQPEEWEALPSAMQRYLCWSRIPCQRDKQPLAGTGSKWWQKSCICIARQGKSYSVHCGGFCVQHVLEDQRAWS